MAVREFLLPDLGEGLEDAEIVAWRVASGDTVALNQTLVEVNTAKALVEIPSPWAGVVHSLHAAEGEVVKVGAPLVSLRVEDEPERAAAQAPAREAILVGYGVNPEEPAVEVAAGSRRERHRERVPASPPVRRLARELGIDLATVTGSGPGGRITREDLLAASDTTARPATAEDEEVERVPVRGTRRLSAEHVARATREIPMVTTFLTIDATNLQALRADLERTEGERVSPLPIVVRALAETCGRHPTLNASFDAEASEILLRRRVHVGIATDTERGLLVTVARDADRRGILELAADIARLTAAARAGSIAPHEVTGSTITVTNVGSFGSESGTPIINHPEAAILALGVIEPRALVVQGRVEARPATTLSLTFDHRVLDGAEAGRALKDLGELLESPFRLGALPRRSPA